MADLTGKRVGARNRIAELRESILVATEVEQVTLTGNLAYKLPATMIRAEVKGFFGTGTVKLAQWSLVNLTKLGLPSLM